MPSAIHHLRHISTPTCFGTEVPSSERHYSRCICQPANLCSASRYKTDVTPTPPPVVLLPNAGQGLFILEVSRSHSLNAPQSVELLWTSDQPVAETSTRQLTTLTTNIRVPGGIRTHNLSRRAAADLCLRRRGHWDRHERCIHHTNITCALIYIPL